MVGFVLGACAGAAIGVAMGGRFDSALLILALGAVVAGVALNERGADALGGES